MNGRRGVPSRSAQAGFALAILGAVLAAAGFGAAYSGVTDGFVGFRIMGLGLLISLVALVTSIVGLAATRPHKGRLGADKARRGAMLSFAVAAIVLAPAFRVGLVPMINDITTDFEDPPVFVAAAELEPNRGRDMKYPGESFASQQRDGYPDLTALTMAIPPEKAFDKARTALASMPNTQIIGENREEGRIEAVQTSQLFKFQDDIVVRIRPTQDGSRIDVRSKSRVGKGDQGANARRIRELYELMRWH